MIFLMQAGGSSDDRTALTVAVISAVVAIVAAAISGLTYRENRRMADANDKMAATNQSMAHSAEISALTAREAIELQRRSEQSFRKACLQLAQDKYSGGISLYENDDEYEGTTGGITFYIRNDGKYPASNCRLTMRSEGVETHGSQFVRIEPGEVAEFHASFAYLPLIAAGGSKPFLVLIPFTDGLGPDEFSFPLDFSPNGATIGHPGFSMSEICTPLAAS